MAPRWPRDGPAMAPRWPGLVGTPPTCARVPRMVSQAQRPSRAKVVARNVGPWLVAALALGWVFHSVNLAKFVAAFQHAPLGALVAASVVLLAANWLADCFAMYFTFAWFGCRVPYRELLIVRAATYILAVVQYYVGQAAIIAYLHQRRGVGVLRASGFILFISGINMGVLVLLAAFGLATGNMPVRWLRYIPFAVGIGSLLYAVLLAVKPRRLAAVRLLAPLFEMGVRGHLKATVVRLPHVLVLVLWHFIGLRLFGVEVPPLAALVYLPAVFFVAALPISPSGFGTSQNAAVYFFLAYAPGGKEEAVLAYSLALTAISLVIQIGLGLCFLPAGRRLGMRPEAASDEAEVSAALPGAALEASHD
ncbi:MAG: flippase-like domain-containing protein [Myxococcales bacterium]|nr:flippase-like domain-containing protein [Myxococcales bacterium]